ncbi:MAG: methyltransferase, partial [Mesorhizobium sp.]
SNTIRIDESIVTEALRNVPSSFTLTSRNPDKHVHFGGNSLVFGLVAGPPNVHDRLNGRRPGNLPDYQNFIRLAHHFNAIHIIGNQVVAPIELPANSRHLDTYHANLTLSDLSFHCTAIGRARAMDGINVMYGAFTSNVDMKSGAPAFGTPENAKANIIAGQLARRYNLPYRTSNANASNVVDLQAAYETEMATWGAVLGGANLIYHAAGWLEGGLTASYEKLVLDVEILQNMMEFLRPLPFQEDDLGFEAIKSVPAGGHFFGAEHTMSRYTTAFYQPMLSN